MFVSLFVRQTKTKDFCEAFKENGFGIDYTFNAVFDGTTVFRTDFVIGSDYWTIVIGDDNCRFFSNQSLVNSDVFGSQYSMAFSLFNGSFHGFIRVRQILGLSFYNNFCLNIGFNH